MNESFKVIREKYARSLSKLATRTWLQGRVLTWNKVAVSRTWVQQGLETHKLYAIGSISFNSNISHITVKLLLQQFPYHTNIFIHVRTCNRSIITKVLWVLSSRFPKDMSSSQRKLLRMSDIAEKIALRTYLSTMFLVRFSILNS